MLQAVLARLPILSSGQLALGPVRLTSKNHQNINGLMVQSNLLLGHGCLHLFPCHGCLALVLLGFVRLMTYAQASSNLKHNFTLASQLATLHMNNWALEASNWIHSHPTHRYSLPPDQRDPPELQPFAWVT